ncbi:hypothetical protein ZIOFF_033909 [Zingiber officinale]|uniref:Uncharacterized protein n=1 Tax=Zingiber officinale TaxID=94328 RepID=A0A8J5L7S0_ZINOF|nr:hypothetical protein ZIOFF_033909 [Zingiber officinale]
MRNLSRTDRVAVNLELNFRASFGQGLGTGLGCGPKLYEAFGKYLKCYLVWANLQRMSLIRPSLASLLYSSSPSSKVTEIYGNKSYLVDTSTLVRRLEVEGLPANQAYVRRLEAQGLPPNQAYIIISTLTTFLNTNLDHLTQSVVSKSAINEFKAEQNSDLSQFKLKMKHMQEIIEVEAGLEAGKFEIMKYCVGTFVSARSICLAFVLFWK